MKKLSAKFLCVVLSLVVLLCALPVTVYAEGTTVINVGSAEALVAACTAINTNGGMYTINLTGDIENGCIDIKKENAVVTVNGNNHTIFNDGTAVYVSDGAKVILGGDNSTLTLKGSGNSISGTTNDNPGLIHVLPGSECEMNANVTLKDHKGNNYLGSGVTVQGGIFIMNGGTIENCGIDGGSVCYGGGVAVFNSGYFEMKGGTITKCYAKSDFPAQDYDRQYTAMGGGVFVSGGSVFTMSGGTISDCEATCLGGGVAVVGANNINKFNSKFCLISGTISGNKASSGAGIFASGFHYAKADAIAMNATINDVPGAGNSGSSGATESSTPNTPGLFISGGLITGNTATGTFDSSVYLFPKGIGGGILVSYNGNTKFQIHNSKITSNSAEYGAGIASFYYNTNADVDSCTITDNTAKKTVAACI